MISYAWLNNIWEAMSGDVAAGVPLLTSAQRRLLTFTALLTFVIALVWVTLTGVTLINERPVVALLSALAPFMFLPFPYLVLRTQFDLNGLSHLYLGTLFAIVTATAASIGGAVSTTSFFLMLIPLLATLLLGIRAGVAWAGLVALTFAALHFGRAYLPEPAFQTEGVAPNQWLRVGEVSGWNATMMTLLALAASLSVANFRSVVSKSSALLVAAARTTQGALKAQEVAEEVGRARAEFMANVSHELRTPLNAIIGYSELLAETAEERGDMTGAQDNRRVLEAASNLRKMINDILKLSAIDAGRVSVDAVQTDIEDLVRDAVLALSRTSEVQIAFNCIGVTPPIRIDGGKLDQCVRELLAHAIAHGGGRQVEISLTSRTEGGRTDICIAITDSGPTVDQHWADRLFEPFISAEDTRHPRSERADLGLAVSRRTARLFGGDVHATVRENGGLQLTLTAPEWREGNQRVAPGVLPRS